MAIKTIPELRQVLSQPGAAFRSAPFWGWNDRLDPQELRRQLRDMREKGMGGAFIHSREGLETPYLSEEWMEDVEASLAEAKDQGMELWIYDEDKWPSGSAGGMVSAADREAFTAKGLTLEVLPAGQKAAPDTFGIHTVGIYPARVEGNHVVLGRGEHLVVLRSEISGNSEWYNGFAPPDNLNPDAVKTFLNLTHERYRQRFGKDFGGTIKGFFTDEPNCCDFYSEFTPGRPWLPWTEGMTEYFAAKRGYDPTPKLPLLFFRGDGCEKIRHDYWRTIAELFSQSYMKQLYDYCEAQGVELTGHILYENDLGYHIRVCGAAMPQYRYLHRPGIDILGEQAREYLTVRQCASVANQYGRENTISETYGCTGWEFDFEGQKWLADWQFVNGITRRCQHLALYSITGCRKRDYPPVFNYQNSWWEYNKAMEDYFARVTACVQTGEVQRDILMLHPISGLWTQCGCDPDEDLHRVEMNMGWTDRHIMSLNEQGDRFNRLTEALLRNHLDFDFGDEIILAENASVDSEGFRVGLRHYRTVIVPETCSLFASTLTLLEQFAQAGGRVIWMGELPTMEEGAPSDRPARLVAHCGISRAADQEELLEILNRDCRTLSVQAVTGGEDTRILTMLRKTEDGYVLFAVNHDREAGHDLTFRLNTPGKVTALDPWTGDSADLPVQIRGGQLRFAQSLAPAETRVYFIEPAQQPLLGSVRPPYEHPHRTEAVFAVLGPEAAAQRTEPNALTLDLCAYCLDGEPLSGQMEVWMAQREIRRKLGMPAIYYNGAPQRYTWLTGSRTGRPFTMEFRFTVLDVPEGECYLAVEKPESLSLSCNGQPCVLTDRWYSDRATKCFALPELKAGENRLTLSGMYTEELELENVFLIGDFGVNAQREIVKESEKLHFGDWCTQGYFHYSGSMVYTFPVPGFTEVGRRVELHMGDFSATVAEVLVNGTSAGLVFGKSRRCVDITNLLQADGNTVQIKLTGSPRNLYGPFHQPYTGCSRISWEDFRKEGADRCDGYVLQPYGLFEQITLVKI